MSYRFITVSDLLIARMAVTFGGDIPCIFRFYGARFTRRRLRTFMDVLSVKSFCVRRNKRFRRNLVNVGDAFLPVEF